MEGRHPTNLKPLVGFSCIPRRLLAPMASNVGLADRAHIEGPAQPVYEPAPEASVEDSLEDLDFYSQECEIAQHEYEHDTELEAARSTWLM